MGPTQICFPFILFSYVVIFLIALVYEIFASIHYVFYNKYTTCRCIFDVFAVGGELCVLLFCHLDLCTLSLFIPLLYIHSDIYFMDFNFHYGFFVCEMHNLYNFF